MHKSVLLEESIELLNIKENGVYVDCTLGYGGHSSEILKRIKTGFLFAFDQDEDAIKFSNDRLSKVSNNFEIIKSNFANLSEELKKRNVTKVDGIIFDLGVSSPQLDCDERGFSYHNDALLDMRMDKNNPLSAYIIVNTYSYDKLVDVLRKYGEEKYASSIVKNIIKAREEKEIRTTLELVDIIKKSVPMKKMREKHPARQTFQALRIEVNNELNVLESGINQAIDLLGINGRLCVITFHSLEDRIVKNIFRKMSEVDSKIKGLPFIPNEYLPKVKVIGKSIVPSNKETEENNRSRSARLRVIEKIKGD